MIHRLAVFFGINWDMNARQIHATMWRRAMFCALLIAMPWLVGVFIWVCMWVL